MPSKPDPQNFRLGLAIGSVLCSALLGVSFIGVLLLGHLLNGSFNPKVVPIKTPVIPVTS